MKIPLKTLILGIALVLVLGGAYLYFFSGSPAAPLTATAPATADEQQFLDVASELEPISFDTSILTDPRFEALVDITVPISPEPQGRTDPFAPLQGVAAPGK